MLRKEELKLIKQYIELGYYEFLFDVKEGAALKTKEFMMEKCITRELLAEYIVRLKEKECFKESCDNQKKHDDGDVFEFHSFQLGDELYIKVKVPTGNSNMLVFSVHYWKDYRRI